MKILKEKVIGTRGPWLFKARIAEYHTKEGKFARPEVVFEKMGNDETGFTVEDLKQVHNSLVQFANENLYSL